MSRFDPWTATFEEAEAAQRDYPGPTDPDAPIFQWAGAQRISLQLRPRVEAGDGNAAMDAVSQCLRRGLVAPDWLARKFLRCYDQVLNCRVGSWDEAFGPPFPKGKQLARMRFNRHARFAVSNAVLDAIQRDPHRPIDAGLFEEVGRQVGAGKTLAEELYREAVAMGAVDAAEVKKRLLSPGNPAKSRKLAGISRRR